MRFSPALALGLLGCVLGGLILGSSCSNEPAGDDCDKLVDHLIEVQLDEKKVPVKTRATHFDALKEDMGPGLLKRCQNTLRGDQVRCALKAKTSKAIEICDL